MVFKETAVKGAYLVELDPRGDIRGFFARAWCSKEFETQGLKPKMVQANTSFNKYKGTLRGLHYQAYPKPEAKFMRCIRGRIYDVLVDLRPESPTFKKWVGVELTAENRLALYVPEQCAHGYLSLKDGSEVLYLVSEFYSPECERGIRYDDVSIKIDWPTAIEHISEKDLAWALLEK
ncbi:MAG: dTDP-4-dehydrorhamnose 3,5-epimerase [Nitrospira sp.]|jgi:dTDP-4-dehydrorhamnose 3,5-epimerase|nr:MAG: dTDP-4-dehydrorhamnose 3,5-epimerase [Nitrospira sp.]